MIKDYMIECDMCGNKLYELDKNTNSAARTFNIDHAYIICHECIVSIGKAKINETLIR